MTRPARTSSRYGFTLVEMSIIVLIIAILLAVVITSSDLLRSSKILKILVQVEEYNNATALFKQKYKELPGDLSNAESFWGSDTACPNTVYNAKGHVATCNGDGNGTIGNYFVDGGTTSYEILRAWQHLSNAGMLSGTYSGTQGSSGVVHSMPGTNVPRGALKGTGFSLLYIFLPNGNADYFPARYNHAYIYGKFTASSFTNGRILKPQEAFQIDQKVDDGKPASGTMLTNKSTIAAGCTSTDTASLAQYNVTFDEDACDLIMISGF